MASKNAIGGNVGWGIERGGEIDNNEDEGETLGERKKGKMNFFFF